MKKCLKNRNFYVCINYARFQKNLGQPFLFLYLKKYINKENITFCKLLMPYTDFYNYIYKLEMGFINYLSVQTIENKLSKKLKLNMFSIVYSHLCKGFDKDKKKKY